MSGWGGGYVTDVTYLAQHYPEQSPHMLAAACVVSGVDPGFTGEAPGLHYLELGCGRGMNALVVAAGNPRWRVTAIDFTPAAIAEGRRTAAAAGLENITFIEADLAGFAETVEARALPEADFVSMHGVWSWVPVAVRAGIVRLLAAKLRAGGVVHVSYNVLPGLQGALGMQRLIRAAGGALAQRSDRQVLAGRQVVMDLVAAEALHLRTPVVTELLRHLEKAPVEYLAHEFMNATWAPCFQADVAEALADAKLELVASAKLPENFLGLMLAPAQIAVLERFDDPRLRELVKDICVDRALRHDVYVRGPQRLDRAVQDSLLRGMTLALTVLPGNFAYQIEMPAGRGRGAGLRAAPGRRIDDPAGPDRQQRQPGGAGRHAGRHRAGGVAALAGRGALGRRDAAERGAGAAGGAAGRAEPHHGGGERADGWRAGVPGGGVVPVGTHRRGRRRAGPGSVGA